MNNFLLGLVLCSGLMSTCTAKASGIWTQTTHDQAPQKLQLIHPEQYRVYLLDENPLKLKLWNLSSLPAQGEIISIPMPDGTMRDFNVWETSMMPQSLADKYPMIKTFTATALDNPTTSAKIDFTAYGFHAMVYDGDNTCFVDPYDNFHDGYYISYYKRDLKADERNRMMCSTGDEYSTPDNGHDQALKTINGYELRTYDLALGCSSQYANAVTFPTTPTKPTVLSKMTTTMNRVNGIYEREFSLTMKFVSNTDQLIFITSSGDPYFANNNNGPGLLTANQIQCTSIIGNEHYDIGHVFSTGSGGIATLGCVCSTTKKAQGTTGRPDPVGDAFDVDYVAHEMGHQFGSQHTFNNNQNGSCAGTNAVASMAYEPGSGSTIMAYAGICSPDNVQAHSDPYFHRASIEKILQKITGSGNCATRTPTSNKLVKYDPATVTLYNIPYLTPFELGAPIATDSVGDSVILYSWEEDDLSSADFGKTFATTTVGPIFRSYNPTAASNTRVFPRMSSVLVGNLNFNYEKAPTVARTMKFKCIYRNIRNNMGCVTIPDETITVKAVTTGTGSGFKVTSQSTGGVVYDGGSTQTITWTVLNTTAPPISTDKVDIYMSDNGGTAWRYFVGTFPNTGSASVTIPNPHSDVLAARIKVQGHNNVFFNVNTSIFKVNFNSSLPPSPDGVDEVAKQDEINVFPVPAKDLLNISTEHEMNVSAINAIGQKVWQGSVVGNTSVDVSTWSAGIYYLQLTNASNGRRTVKQVIIQ